ncbi:conserved unknown protein [Ectocarpus siliculosus]|uniref:VPS9 domain-containing protein n=1 Tax=Ectocarpus siliculosus TaxID=2880 RepID=D8LL17_ECTSI|nr:conserved unknown protein [Ectocarpus siliculosus]|eukprot:CBN76111.1 conserved unknown protein [Ectocarpus siliculosus]
MTAAATELFPHDVPVLRTSLVRHGLVDLSTSPRARKAPAGPASSQDLAAGDRGEEQWTKAAAAGGNSGFQALVGVNSVVVGHVRAAEELRASLRSPPSPRDLQKIRAPGTPTRRGEQPKSAEERLRKRSVSLRTDSPSAQAAASSRRQRAGSAASIAATLAMAAVRRGDRPYYVGAAGGASRGSPEQTPQPTEGVSMANLLDIAVSLFGSGDGAGGRGGRHSIDGDGSSKSSGVVKSKKKEEKLVTFTVDVHTGGSMTLGVTVKELGGGAVFVEDVRKLPGGSSGPAELAGILVGDVILGINYEPLEKGLVHTSTRLAEAIALAGFVKLQISRCVRSKSWRQSLPRKDCALVSELMWRTAQLRKAGSAERHSIAGLVLQRMAWEEGTSRALAPLLATTPPVDSSLESAASALLDSLVLEAKGLRKAIDVRCLHTRTIVETVEVPSVWGPTSSEVASSDAKAAPPEAATPASTRATVRFVVRVEDVGTGRQWLVFPHYGDLSALRQELLAMWPPIADLPFPAKRSSVSRAAAAETAETEETVVEERVVRLEAFLDGALSLLGMYVSIDPRCSGALHIVQDFLGRPEDLFNADLALSPALRDQKRAELLLYRLLNQADSPAARMKHLLMRDFESDTSLAPDVDSLMKCASSRLRRLQDFVLDHHEEQLSSCAYTTSETREAIVRKAVRRQVELSLYLPLRRCLWKELTWRIRDPARKLERAIQALRRSPPAVFGLETLGVLASKEWGPVKEVMGQATRNVLPTDQIDGLRRAAEHLTALHASLQLNACCDNGDASTDATDSSCNGRSGSSGALSVDSRRASLKLYSREDGKGEAGEEDGEEGSVRAEGATAPTHGTLCPEEGEFGIRERDSNGLRLGGRPDRQTRAVSDSFTGDGGRATNDVASDSDGPSSAPALSLADEEQRLNVVQELVEDDLCWQAQCVQDEDIATEEVDREALRPNFNSSRSWSALSTSHDISPTAAKSSTSSWDSIGGLNEGAAPGESDGEGEGAEEGMEDHPEVAPPATQPSDQAMGADDFLPLFALVLVHSAPLDLLLPQTMLTHLMDLDGSLSEAGYLVATLEAAVSFITQVHASSLSADGNQDSSP